MKQNKYLLLLTGIIYLLLNILFINCIPQESTGSDSNDVQTQSITVSGIISLPDGAPDNELQNATAYVAGQVDDSMTLSSDGVIAINVDLSKSGRYPFDAPTTSGDYEYDIIVQSESGDYGLKIPTSLVTEALGKMKKKNSSRAAVALPDNLEFQMSGGILGNIQLPVRGDNSGIEVQFPGTLLTVITDANGDYSISGVPPGDYRDFIANKEGYDEIHLENVGINENEFSQMPAIVMFVAGSSPTDAQAVSNDKASLTASVLLKDNVSLDDVTGDLNLLSMGPNASIITWSSSNTTYLTNAGVVTRPAYATGNQVITLTATITKGESVETKEFIITITAIPMTDAEKVAADKAGLDYSDVTFVAGNDENNISGDFSFPATGDNGSLIIWAETTDTGNNITVSGTTVTVSRPAIGAGNGTATITATITSNSESDTKILTFIIIEIFGGGDGSGGMPYEINNAVQLNEIRNYLSNYFGLYANIDLSSYSSGSGWVPINNFTGFLEGNGKSISNLTIDRTTDNNQGLFGVNTLGSFSNVILLNVSIKGGYNTGALVGQITNITGQTVTKCYVSGTITAESDNSSNTGGIIGIVDLVSMNALISKCISNITITGTGFATSLGGIVGYHNSNSSIIENCYFTGSISQVNIGSGGIAGLTAGTVRYCFSTGNISTTYASGDAKLASVTGEAMASSTVTDCIGFSQSVSSGSSGVYRVIYPSAGTLTNLYAYDNMSVTGGDVSTDTTTGADGADLSTDAFKNSSSFCFDNWDFTNTWQMTLDGPILRDMSVVLPAQDPIPWD